MNNAITAISQICIKRSTLGVVQLSDRLMQGDCLKLVIATHHIYIKYTEPYVHIYIKYFNLLT